VRESENERARVRERGGREGAARRGVVSGERREERGERRQERERERERERVRSALHARLLELAIGQPTAGLSFLAGSERPGGRRRWGSCRSRTHSESPWRHPLRLHTSFLRPPILHGRVRPPPTHPPAGFPRGLTARAPTCPQPRPRPRRPVVLPATRHASHESCLAGAARGARPFNGPPYPEPRRRAHPHLRPPERRPERFVCRHLAAGGRRQGRGRLRFLRRLSSLGLGALPRSAHLATRFSDLVHREPPPHHPRRPNNPPLLPWR
jgi:hypothetical protein